MRSWTFVASVALALVGLAKAEAEVPSERGRYLVDVLAACAGCHTPQTPSGSGSPLSGGSRFGSPESGVFAPNITPDRQTGIGAWTDRQIIDAIRRGVRPDGSHIGPPMPQTAYRQMSDADAQAIAAYLRDVPAVSRLVPRSVPKTVPVAPAPAAARPAGPEGGPADRGRYIATALSHCTECHTPVGTNGTGGTGHLDEGGRTFRAPKGVVVAPAITAKALVRFTDRDLVDIITNGVKPDSSKIVGPMPVKAYAGYTAADLKDLLAFLRSDQNSSQSSWIARP